MATRRQVGPPAAGALDRGSFIPLYYQLQEHLKELIEAGVWSSGDRLPSEPELCRLYGVSRTVVRQALTILEDDRQIVRERARGTFVAAPKLDRRVGGISRLLLAPRTGETRVRVLDTRALRAERSIADALGTAPGTRLTRLTTVLEVRDLPLAISYSFFRREDADWLTRVAARGAYFPGSTTLAEHGVSLAHASVTIETSRCGKFEAEIFDLPHRSAVFLTRCVEHRWAGQSTEPYELARVEYRGDIVQFALELRGERSAEPYAIWDVRASAGRERGG